MTFSTRFTKRSVGVTTTLLFVFASISCSVLNIIGSRQSSGTPPVLEWDFAQSHTVAQLDAGTREKGETAYYRDVRLRLRLPGDRVFDEELNALLCQRRNDVVENIIANMTNMTLDEAYREADRLIRYWNFDRKNFDEWYAQRKANAPAFDDRFYTRRNDLEPALSLELRHSYNDEKPWYIEFQVGWEH